VSCNHQPSALINYDGRQTPGKFADDISLNPKTEIQPIGGAPRRNTTALLSIHLRSQPVQP
jgi:hypothetical protein